MANYPFRIPASASEADFVAGVVPTSLGPIAVYRTREATVAPRTLLLHGVGMSSTAWVPLLQAARAHGLSPNCLLVDIPGFGASARLRRAVTLEEVGGAVVQALEAVGSSEPVTLVGHSMGGFLAMDLAARMPQQFSSLITVAGAYGTIVDSVNHPVRTALRAPSTVTAFSSLRAMSHFGRAARPLLRSGARTGLLRLALRGMSAHPLQTPDDVLWALADGIEPKSFSYAMHTGVDYDYRTVWSAITARTLALFGQLDLMVTRRDAAVVERTIDHATIRVIGDTAHFLAFEAPDRVLEEILAFDSHALG